MATRPFQPSRKADSAIDSQQFTPAAAVSFSRGAPLQRNAGNPNRVEAHAGGAVVTGIIGVSGAQVVSGLPAAKGDTPYGTTIPVHKARGDIDFFGQVTNGATPVVVTGDGTLEGDNYGFIANSGIWTVDIGDTTDVVLRVVKELPELNGVLFRFLPSAVAD